MARTEATPIFSCIARVLRFHWLFALLATAALALLLTNLGSDYLWADEGDTAVLASSIVKYGVPKAWDGVTFTDSDRGARVNSELVMVSHPWAQYYLAAFSFLCLGETAFAARLPFALAGWLTILLAYSIVWRITANRRAAFAAATLLVLSVQFLLYSRQCRNYSLNMLLTCWLIWIFLRMKSLRDGALFALAAILLFHTQPLGLVPVGVLGLLTIAYRPLARQRRWFWTSLPAVLLFTVPWLLRAQSGYAESTQRAHSMDQFIGRLTQYLIECASVTPLIGTVVLLGICWISRRQEKKKKDDTSPAATAPWFLRDEQSLLLVTFATLVAYGLVLGLTQSSNLLWLQGLRYAPALIPLLAIIAGILITKVSGDRPLIWLGLLFCFGFTQLPYLSPWLLWYHDVEWPEQKELVKAHAPARLVDHFLRGEQLFFLSDLWSRNPGVVGHVCEFLRQHAEPSDGLIANYCWEPLYFHTRLLQCLKILPDYPVAENARRKGLPEYVFGIGHARWVVWRPLWEGYQGYRWEEIAAEIEREGGKITQVAELKETVWENRENIHFRRFSGDRYLFPWPETFPAAAIFRVDWPEDSRFEIKRP
jgi:4-amino-4-deoxy-L-arabinose transferase-like glycosyltransferase